MSALAVSVIAFAVIFGGALLGLLLRRVLPERHLDHETREVVKLGMGLVGTTTALVLGLLVASAKNSYDAQGTEVTHLAANVAVLDRILAHYGPETKETRALLREVVSRLIDRTWSKDERDAARQAPSEGGGESIIDKIHALRPENETERAFRGEALSVAVDLAKTHWLMYTQQATSVSMPLVILLVLWLTVIFVSFGLFAPLNATALCSLLVSALAVSGAIFVILELYSPYSGVIQISSAPLSSALSNLGR